MSRPLAGIACRIRIPVRQYQAVALVIRDRKNIIRLMHREAGLSLDIEEFENFATAEEYRDRLAGFLDLPPVTAAGVPSNDDDVAVAPSKARRAAALRSRRPRFLSRRRFGGLSVVSRVEGREIIARD